MLTGIGDLVVKTTGLTNNLLVPVYPFNWSYSAESTRLDAKGQVAGRLRTLQGTAGEETNTLTMSTQYTDWITLGLFLDQQSQVETAPVIPTTKTGVVPSVSPFTIADASIVSGNLSTITAYVTSVSGGIETRTVITTGTVAAGQVLVAAGTLTFHSSDAGKSVGYQISLTYANTKSYGGQNTNKYGNLEMWGKLYPTNNPIWFPSVDIVTKPSIELTGDVATLEIELTPNIPVGLAGWTEPYKIFENLVLA